MRRHNKHLLSPGLFSLAALVPAAALKYHYHHASGGKLGWILGPTATLVGAATGSNFVFEAGTGWVSMQQRLIIAPSCAGVNFLIVCFLSLAALSVMDQDRGRLHPARLPAAFCFAYGVTLMVNAVRIIVALYVREADILGGWLTAQRLHRLEGVVVYLAGLGASAKCWGFLGRRISARPFQEITRKGRVYPWLAPLGIYALVMVGVPFIRGIARGLPPAFLEHVLTIAGVAAVVWGMPFLLRRKVHGGFERRKAEVEDRPAPLSYHP